ncbi:phospholipid phosphatase 1-like isoform X2 [Oratosquilla oratoria]|uniref:phospholipid phosphatase 1-like isoform X2 n=2 Tax=Oratosquilla oratoria TaxID=337810 RepID=UPI003F774EA5
MESKYIVRIAVDLIILVVVAFPILLFFLLGKPFERGLHCDDESLMYPYKDSTISSLVLYVVGTFLPVVAMGIVELTRVQRENIGKRIIMCKREVHPWFWAMHTTIGPFLFACACSQLLTDIAKYSVGRLRPHFWDICKPDMSQMNCTVDHYVDPVPCTTDDTFRLKEARLSFPSGHASFSAVTMVYFAIYLQARLHTKIAVLIRPVMQFFALTLTIYTTLSRISDYKHHWSDVMAGFILGSTVAILVSLYVSDLFRAPAPKLMKNTQHIALQDCHPGCAESATSVNGERTGSRIQTHVSRPHCTMTTSTYINENLQSCTNLYPICT